MTRKYILYIPNSDGTVDDDCRILDTADSYKEALQTSKDWEDYEAYWVSYDFDGKNATNGRLCKELGNKYLLRES